MGNCSNSRDLCSYVQNLYLKHEFLLNLESLRSTWSDNKKKTTNSCGLGYNCSGGLTSDRERKGQSDEEEEEKVQIIWVLRIEFCRGRDFMLNVDYKVY